MKKCVMGSVALAAVMLMGCSTTSSVKCKLSERLPVYGHRNWIVVADSAYPKQSAAGIETVYVGGGQVEALKAVLEAIEAAPHVQAVVMVDAELAHVAEQDAPGIGAFRKELKTLLAGRQAKVMPHEEIIAQLDKGAELFNVLLLKTDMVLPYTSVFIQLDCGYWSAEKEARLRKAISEKAGR